MVGDIPWVSLWQSQLCPHPTSCPSQPPPWNSSETKNALRQCKHSNHGNIAACYRHCFGHYNTALYRLLWWKLTSLPPDSVQTDKKDNRAVSPLLAQYCYCYARQKLIHRYLSVQNIQPSTKVWEIEVGEGIQVAPRSSGRVQRSGLQAQSSKSSFTGPTFLLPHYVIKDVWIQFPSLYYWIISPLCFKTLMLYVVILWYFAGTERGWVQSIWKSDQQR